eukprot:1422228-Rhodomonas_salina.3
MARSNSTIREFSTGDHVGHAWEVRGGRIGKSIVLPHAHSKAAVVLAGRGGAEVSGEGKGGDSGGHGSGIAAVGGGG